MATVDDHMCSMGWGMMEMGMKWNLMMRMKIHVQCLHNPTCAQGEGGGCVCLMGDIPVVFYTSITRMQINQSVA